MHLTANHLQREHERVLVLFGPLAAEPALFTAYKRLRVLSWHRMSLPTPDPPSPPRVLDSPWEDLVVSILSVNHYSLERTYSSLLALREQKITDPLS